MELVIPLLKCCSLSDLFCSLPLLCDDPFALGNGNGAAEVGVVGVVVEGNMAANCGVVADRVGLCGLRDREEGESHEGEENSNGGHVGKSGWSKVEEV